MTNAIETNLVTDPPFSPRSPKPRILEAHVEYSFEIYGPFQKGDVRENPIHRGRFVHDVDPIAPQKSAASRALIAREWFYEYGPHDGPPLPVSSWEIDDMRYSRWKSGPKAGFYHVIAQFASSLRYEDWDFKIHPSFEDFASSMLASDYARHLDLLKNDEKLCKRFPPRALCTIGPGGVWNPAEGERQAKLFAHRK
jgi:hypothetical protein